MNRILWYAGANLLFALLVALGSPGVAVSGVHPAYLLALFLLCSTPILHLRSLNDRYAVPGLFMGMYFIFYGWIDFGHMWLGIPGSQEGDWLSKSEELILVGGGCAYVASLLAGRIWNGAGTVTTPRDLPEWALTYGGCALWLACFCLSWHFRLYVLSDTVIETQDANLARAGALMSAIYILATYLLPLSILVLAYAQTHYRRDWLLPLLVVVVLAQATMGFAEDSKGDTVLGLVIVLVTKTLTGGRVPRNWLLAGVLAVGVAWPVMQANRFVREHYSMSRPDVASHMLLTLQRAVEAKTSVTSGPERANTFFERASLKGSVELIVVGTDHGIPFQDGHTLTPIALAFIPRLIWPDKPDVQPGLIMNKVFQVVPDSPDTYISPSYLGDMYWNFGWTGVLAGMTIMGLLLGYLGARFELARAVTLPRVMVMAASVYQLIWGFEGALSGTVVWIRSMAAIGLLYLLLARRTAQTTRTPAGDAGEDEDEGAASPLPVPFPNLMR